MQPPPQTPFSYNPSHSAPTNYLRDIQPLFSDSEDSDTDERTKSSPSSTTTSSSSSSSSSSAGVALHPTTSWPSAQAQSNKDEETHIDTTPSPILHDFPMFSPLPSAPSSSPGSLHQIDLDSPETGINIFHSNDDDTGITFDDTIGCRHLMEEDDIDEEGVPVTRVYHPYLNGKCSIYI